MRCSSCGSRVCRKNACVSCPTGATGSTGSTGQTGATGAKGATGSSGGGSFAGFDLSVNSAQVDAGFSDGSIVLRTGAVVNPVGAYTGGGTGNKSIAGIRANALIGQPLSALSSFEIGWRDITGPAVGTIFSPYGNFLVDFSPDPAGIRLIAVTEDALSPTIAAAIGAYTGVPGPFPVGPDYVYRWDSSLPAAAGGSVLVVGILGPLGPGGVAPSVSVPGLFWTSNAFSWASLVAANPLAKIVEAFPNDGGMPAGAVIPPVSVISGDSGSVTRSGKRITKVLVNGTQFVP